VESAGSLVDEEISNTIRKQRYKPGMKGGKPVRVRIERTYTFRSG
jgi:hypothetical protein